MNEAGAESRRFPRRHIWIAVFAFFISLLFWLYNSIFISHTSFSREKTLSIAKGSSVTDIARVLRREGVISSEWAFTAYVISKGARASLLPGEYTFSPNQAIPEIAAMLKKGEHYPNERVLTIPEGWNLKDIGLYFEAKGVAKKESFWQTAGYPATDYGESPLTARPADFSKNFPFLNDKPDAVGLEGFLFPDTYRVYRGAAAKDVIAKMLDNFDKKYDAALRAETARRGKTIFEIATMASLVEKEVPSPADKAIVAGILWKRLAAGMPLQVDAAIVYIRGHNHAPLAATDLNSPSRYNTYRYQGLPLGPIANPGLASIRAALYPKESPYWYYLSAPDGRTVFSETLEEHAAAKRKYLAE